jgi:hypothetical protein
MSECKGQTQKKTCVRNCTDELLDKLEGELEKGTQMLICTVRKVKDKELSGELTDLIDNYAKLSMKAAKERGSTDESCGVKEFIGRMTAKIDVEVGTIIDDSDERVAQLLIEDITVSITDIIRLVRDYENSNCSEGALDLARDVVRFQERSVEKLKAYL